MMVGILVFFASCNNQNRQEVQPAQLEGTWEFLGYINDQGIVVSSEEDIQGNPIVEFSAGRYGGSTPNNAFAGEYQLSPNNIITFNEPSSTLASETQWGADFLLNLPRGYKYTFTNGQLRISISTGKEMIFDRKK